jgi:hypothetical protein
VAFDKTIKIIQCGKENLFNNWFGIFGNPHKKGKRP